MVRLTPIRGYLSKTLALLLALAMLVSLVPNALPGDSSVAYAAPGELYYLDLDTAQMELYIGGNGPSSGTFTAYLGIEGVPVGYTGAIPTSPVISAVSSADAIVHVSKITDVPGSYATFSVQAVSEGTAYITVTAQQSGVTTIQRTLAVTVGKSELISLALAQTALTLDLASTPYGMVEYVIAKTGSPDISVSVSSDDSSIASVVKSTDILYPDTIVVTGHAVGNTLITVTASDGTITRQVQLPVSVIDTTPTPAPVVEPTSVGFSAPSVDINIPLGDNSAIGTIGYAVYPTTGITEGGNVTLYSSNPNVVAVAPTSASSTSGTLTLTAVGPGSASVTITTGNGKSATLIVNVTKEMPSVIPATGITLGAHNITLTIPVSGTPAESRTIPYVITPTNYNSPAAPIAVSATTSDASIVDATVNSQNGTVTLDAVAAGTASVTITTSNGLTDVINVTVVQLTNEIVYPESIAFDVDAITLIDPESGTATQDVGYSILPSYATETDVTVASYNEDVVTASVVGGVVRLIVVGPGTAEVVVKTENNLTDSLSVTVVPENEYVPSTGVAFDTASVDIVVPYYIGSATQTVSFSIYPLNTDDMMRNIVSSNDGIVTVGNYDPFTRTITLVGLRAGTATITLTTFEGRQAVLNVTVTVEEPVVDIVQPVEVEPAYPTVYMFKGDTASVLFYVRNADALETATLATSQETSIVASSVGGYFGYEEFYEAVEVNILGIEAGSDLVTLSVNGVEGSVGVVVYDRIRAVDVSISPEMTNITPDETAQLSLDGLNGLSTAGYEFQWSIVDAMNAPVVISGSSQSTSATIEPIEGMFGPATVQLLVIPPMVNGSLPAQAFTLSAVVNVRQEGELYIDVLPDGAFDGVRNLIKGEAIMLPPAYMLMVWKDGAIQPVSTSTFTFASSDPTVATIDSNGYINPVGAGTATITITGIDYLDLGKTPATYSFTVNVTELPTGISVSPSLEGQTGRDIFIGASLLPAGVEGYIHYQPYFMFGPAIVTDDGLFTAYQPGVYYVLVFAYASYEDFLNAEAPLASKEVKITVRDEPTWLVMNTTPIDIHVGEQYTIDLADYPPYNALLYGTVTGWYSENAAALGVAGSNTIIGLAPCQSQYVYATTSEGFRLYFKFNVNRVYVTSIDIVPGSDAKMLVGDIKQFEAQLTPSDPDDDTVIWSSADESIATVDDIGRVTAVAPGTTSIYVESVDGPKAAITLTVVRKAEGILLDSTLIELYPGNDANLAYTIIADDAEYERVEWSFDSLPVDTMWNGGILYIPQDALPGDYVITASLIGTGYDDQGNLVEDMVIDTDSCVVRVLTAVEEVELADMLGNAYDDDDEILGLVGRTVLVRANVLPTDADDQTLIWDTVDADVATVEAIGLFGSYARITLTGKGSTELIVKSAQSGVTDQIVLNVAENLVDFSLSPKNADLYPGESFTYDVTLVPADTMLADKIAFTSSDDTIATVDEYGTVTAVMPGTVTITATYDNGQYPFTRNASVVVKNPVTDLEFVEAGSTLAELNMKVGGNRDLYALLQFTGMAIGDVTDSTVQWTVEKSNIVSVDGNGVARALSVGDSWVYAYAHNGISAKLHITVTKGTDLLTLSAYDIALWPGENGEITATLNPADSTDVLEWTVVTGQTIVQVVNTDSRTISFKALNPGTTEITATTYDATTYGTANEVVTAEKKCIVMVKQPVTTIQVDSILPVAEPIGIIYPKTVTSTYLGQKIQLVATALPDTAYDKSVIWSVWDQTVATIDSVTGMLTSVGVGSTVAVATSQIDNTVYGIINVTVVRGQLQFGIDPEEMEIYPTESFIIDPYLLPEGSPLPAVEYTIADATIATIRTSLVNGETACKVTGVTPGTTEVLATIYKGTPAEMTASCALTVLIPVKTMTVAKDRIRMLVGDQYRYDLADDLVFNGGVIDDQPADMSVTYVSRNEAIATVDEWGQIEAHQVGVTTIDITSNANPQLRAQVIVEVVELAAGIMADAAEIRVYPGKKIPVNFTMIPEEIASEDIVWTYFDQAGSPIDADDAEAIAYYKDGFVYTLAPGYIEMVASVEIPDDIVDLYSKYPSLQLKTVSTSILVTVLTPVESVEIVTLNGEPIVSKELTYKVGDKFLLGTLVAPDTADDQEIYWTSSDPNLASVDSFGIITCNGIGTVKIYATSRNSGAQDSVTLTVEKGEEVYLKKYGVTTASKLFVRSLPSLQGIVYTKFKKGTKVTIVGEYGEWYQIAYSSGTDGVAYVHKYYVRITGTEAPPADDGVGTIVTTSNAEVSNCVTTTVWSGAGSGYRTTAPAGTRVLVLDRSGSYYLISYGHYNLATGYVLASKVATDSGFVYGVGTKIKNVPNANGGYDSYIIDPSTGASRNLVGDTLVISIPTTVTASSAAIYSGYEPANRVVIGRVYRGATLTIISQKMNGYYQVKMDSGVIGWVEASYIVQPQGGNIVNTTTTTKILGKATSNVYVRTGPSTGYKKLATVKKGAQVTILSATTTNGFYQVETSGGLVGYASAKYLKVSTITKEETTIIPVSEQMGNVNCAILNVRELGSMNGVIIDTLKAGEQVRVVLELDGWYHIELPDGSFGFVKSEYITMVDVA